MPLGLGSAFENDAGQQGALREHLWVIISEENSSGQVIMVNLTSWRGRDDDDPTCVVNRGEHEFVHHKTFVKYSEMRFVSIAHLETLKRAGHLEMYPDASDALLNKIWNGAEKSKYTKGKFLSALRSKGYI